MSAEIAAPPVAVVTTAAAFAERGIKNPPERAEIKTSVKIIRAEKFLKITLIIEFLSKFLIRVVM